MSSNGGSPVFGPIESVTDRLCDISRPPSGERRSSCSRLLNACAPRSNLIFPSTPSSDDLPAASYQPLLGHGDRQDSPSPDDEFAEPRTRKAPDIDVPPTAQLLPRGLPRGTPPASVDGVGLELPELPRLPPSVAGTASPSAPYARPAARSPQPDPGFHSSAADVLPDYDPATGDALPEAEELELVDGGGVHGPPSPAQVEIALSKLGGIARRSFSLAADANAEANAPPATLQGPVRGMTDVDVSAISSLLSAPSLLAALACVNLSHNGISDGGAAALGRALGNGAPVLERLVLHENRIGCAGLEALAAALVPGGAAGLRELRLGFNRIADNGACALARSWAAGGATQLREVHLAANDVADVGVSALAAELHNAPLLCVLGLGSAIGGNRVGDDGAHALCSALRLNAGRTFALHLKCNTLLTAAAADALRQAERDCTPDVRIVL